MGKVKKAGAVRKAGKSSKAFKKGTTTHAKKPVPAAKRPAKGPRARAKSRAQPRTKSKVSTKSPTRSTRTATPDRPSFHVRALDPVQKCGPGTSVQQLYRIDEANDRVMRPHLVFFDRHGWYCEHGRTCPAVAHAQRHARQAGTSHGSNHGRKHVITQVTKDRLKTEG